MNLNKFTIKAQEALQTAQQSAFEHDQQTIENAHILKGLLDNDEEVFNFIFNKTGANKKRVEDADTAIINSLPRVSGGNNQQYLSPQANNTLMSAEKKLKDFGDEFVSVEHI